MKKIIMRRRRPLMSILLIFIAASAPVGAQSPAGDQYPARTVRVVVPYSPGGANDILARTVVTKAIADLGQNTVVDNRAGGNTTIGTQLVARAAPDGYTLLTVDNAYTAGPGVQVNPPYDALKDFVRITMIALTSPVLVVHPSVRVSAVCIFESPFRP